MWRRHGKLVRWHMAGKRPRTQRRADARATRKLIHDRERLWSLGPGGSVERPITVVSTAVIDARVAAMRCPQCESEYALREHDATPTGERVVSVRCKLCHVARKIWFRLGAGGPN
jgi:mono/diheme cytochrome c family protein